MTRLQFIKSNRKEIDACLKKHLPDLTRPNDNDRYNWVGKVIPDKTCMNGCACNEVCREHRRLYHGVQTQD